MKHLKLVASNVEPENIFDTWFQCNTTGTASITKEQIERTVFFLKHGQWVKNGRSNTKIKGIY